MKVGCDVIERDVHERLRERREEIARERTTIIAVRAAPTGGLGMLASAPPFWPHIR